VALWALLEQPAADLDGVMPAGVAADEFRAALADVLAAQIRRSRAYRERQRLSPAELH